MQNVRRKLKTKLYRCLLKGSRAVSQFIAERPNIRGYVYEHTHERALFLRSTFVSFDSQKKWLLQNCLIGTI